MDGSEIEKLISEFSKLPGLGRRSAQRIALYLLKNKDRSLLPFIKTLESSHKLISECSECGNVDMTNPCNICLNSNRDNKSICIIEDVSDLWTFERAGVYLFIGRFMAPALTKFRPEADKDRFERMGEYYMSEYNKEWQSILEDWVEYDTTGDGTIVKNEREPLHGSNRLIR